MTTPAEVEAKTIRERAAQAEPVGLAYYTREAWERMRSVAVDRDDMFGTFEQFERANIQRLVELQNAGYMVEEVPIDVRDVGVLVGWCTAHGVPIDSRGRAFYEAYQRREREEFEAAGVMDVDWASVTRGPP